MNDKSIFDDIKKYSSMGKLSVFVGAGVSRLSGFPSWAGLVQGMADEVGYTYEKDVKGNALFSSEELLKVPQIYYLNKDDVVYRDRVEKGFANTCVPNEVHDLILSLHPNHILTTNYDTLIEEAAVKFGRNFSVLNSNDVVAKAETTNYIVKVHGDFSTNFVLKEQDYLDYENNYILIDNIVKTIFATNLVIFVGYGLNDYNIKLILNWVKRIQSDSFVMPVFIHTGDKVSDNEMVYQNGSGLRILDCNLYTDSSVYSEKYVSVLKKILFYNGSHSLSERCEKLQYMYNKIIGIKNLSYIRREDFKSIFRGEYELNDECKIINKTKSFDVEEDEHGGIKSILKCRLNYFEDFFENKEKYEEINRIQYDQVKLFIEKAGVTGIENDKKFEIPRIEISSPAFVSDFIGMKDFCSKEYDNVDDNYKKAYFLSQLGEYAESYTLYTKLLIDAKQDEQWDIYYFSQINRQYLFSIIKNMIQLTTGFQGAINFGKDLKLFYEDFLNKLNYEMGSLNLKKLYSELPYEMRTQYSFLETFSRANCNIEKYYELTKDKYEIEKSLSKQSMSLGISKFDKVKLTMLETEKFLYENMLLFECFEENKVYVKNSLTLWIQAYIKEISKNGNDIFQKIVNTRYSFTLQDIILMSRTFKKDDINYFDMLIREVTIPFEETLLLENYLSNQIDKYENLFKNTLEGSEIFLWKLVSKEIKNLISISPYFVKDNNCKLKVVKFICGMANGHFDVSDRVGMVNKWMRIANVENASQIIEKWFMDKYHSFNNGEIPLLVQERYCNDIAMIVQLLRDTFQKDEYTSEAISKIVIDNSNLDFKYIKSLYPILNDVAKEVYDNKYSINTIYEMMERGYNNSIPECCDEKGIIEKYFNRILKERQDNSAKKITKYTFPSEEETIAEVAAYMFIREMPYEFTKVFNTISDEYDFLLNPKDFGAEKFELEWLFTYSNDLIRKIKNNDQQRKIIIDAIKKVLLTSSMEKNIMVRLFQIYVMLVDDHYEK